MLTSRLDNEKLLQLNTKKNFASLHITRKREKRRNRNEKRKRRRKRRRKGTGNPRREKKDLDIAMNDFEGMQVSDAQCRLSEKPPRLNRELNEIQ